MSLFLVISANAAQVLISEIAKIYFELSSSSAPPGTGIEPIVPALKDLRCENVIHLAIGGFGKC